MPFGARSPEGCHSSEARISESVLSTTLPRVPPQSPGHTPAWRPIRRYRFQPARDDVCGRFPPFTGQGPLANKDPLTARCASYTGRPFKTRRWACMEGALCSIAHSGKAIASSYSFFNTFKNDARLALPSSLWVHRTHEKRSSQSKGIHANWPL